MCTNMELLRHVAERSNAMRKICPACVPVELAAGNFIKFPKAGINKAKFT